MPYHARKFFHAKEKENFITRIIFKGKCFFLRKSTGALFKTIHHKNVYNLKNKVSCVMLKALVQYFII